MATDIKAASVYASTEFRIDNKSFQNLKKFENRILAIKKKFDGMTDVIVKGTKKQNAALKKQRMQDRIYAKATMFQSRLGGMNLDEAGIRNARKEFRSLVEEFRKGDISASRFNTKVQKLTRNLKTQGVQVKGLNARYRELRRSMINLTAGYSIFAGAAGIAQTGKDLQGSGIMFETLFSDGSQEEMKFIRGEVKRLGLDLVTSAKSYAKFTFSAQKAGLTLEQSREIFSSMNEAAVVFGINTDDVEGIFKALTQMLSKGTVSMEELKQQLGDRMPGALNIAAEQLGYTRDELSKFLKDIEQGKVLAKDAVPAIAKGMREMAAPGLAKALDLLERKERRLITAFQDFKNILFTAGFGDALGFLYEALEDVLAAAKPLAEVFGSTFKYAIWGVVAPLRVLFALLHDIFLIIDWAGRKLGIEKLSSQVMGFVGALVGIATALFAWKKLAAILRGILSIFSKLKSLVPKVTSSVSKVTAGASAGAASTVAKAGSKGLLGRLAGSLISGPAAPLAAGLHIGSELTKRAKESGASRNTLLGDWTPPSTVIEVEMKGEAKEMFKATAKEAQQEALDKIQVATSD